MVTAATVSILILSSYDLLKFSAQRSLTYIDSGRMPKEPGTMSDEDKKKFKKWVENGMKEGSESSSTSEITYDAVKVIVQNSCGSCHTQDQTFPPLGTQSDLKKNGAAALSSIAAGRMPLKSSGKTISTANLNDLKKWLEKNN